MRTLLHSFLILFGTLAATTAWAQPQNPDCNACVCTGAIAGLTNTTVYLAIAAPVPVFPAAGSTVGPNPLAFVGPGANYFRTVNNLVAPNRYLISLCGSVAQNTVMHIRNNAGAAIVGACDDDGCAVALGHAQLVFTPPATANYRIYIFNAACNVAAANEITATVQINITNLGPAVVPNDDPCTATTFPPLTPNCTASISSSTVGSTPTGVAGLNLAPLRPVEACPAPFLNNWSGALQSDVWFMVPTPPSGMLGITTTESSICAGALALYTSPDCSVGPFTPIPGASNWGNTAQFAAFPNGVPCSIEGLSGAGSAPEIIVDLCARGLSPGDPVYIRYWERQNNEQGAFTICAFEPVRPTNDQPCNATALDLTGFACTPITATTQNATPTSGVTVALPSCFTPTYPNYMSGDVWYQVTVPNPVNFTVSAFAGSLTSLGMALYRDNNITPNLCPTGAICPLTYAAPPFSTLTQLSCVTGANPSINTESPAIGLAVGETIYIRMWSNTPFYGSFDICALRNTPPVNDLPCGAITIPVSTDCTYLPTSNTSGGNTSVLNAANPSCGAAPYNADVWYRVQMPADIVAPYGVQVNTQAGGFTNGGIAAYADGPCLNPPALAQLPALCNAPVAPNMPAIFVPVTAVAAGNFFYVRVWRAAGNNGTFNICARRNDPPSCTGTIFDPGGTGPYANNLTGTGVDNSLVTYCAEKAGDVVSLEFQSFAVENGWDFLTIYNGPNILSPVLGTFTGTQDLGTITATITAGNPTGCLTLRFTSDFIINGAGWVAKLYCSPPPPPPPGTFGICNTTVYDPGGANGNYLNNYGNLGTPPWIQTYCPPVPGNGIADTTITLNFTAFNVEGFWDGVFIFNDDNVPVNTLSDATLFTSGGATTFVENSNPGTPWFIGWGAGGTYNGGAYNNTTGSPGTVSATVTAANPNGCLTLMLVSDGSVTPSGWAATVNCGPPPPPPPPPTIGPGPTTTAACGAFFLDSGGNGPYSNAENGWTRTICPAVATDNVTVTFESFNVEASFGGNCYDQVYVYNGIGTAPANMFASTSTWTNLGIGPFNVINGNGLGGWCGTTPPGPFTSSAPNGCLTFQFFSDFSVTPAGWRARITCDPPPPNDDPCPASAQLLTVNTSCTMTAGTNVAASATPSTTAPAPTCGSYTGADVWFRFVAPANGRVFINSESGTLTDAAMELYSGACPGPLVSVECDDDDGENLMPLIDRLCTPLTPGATYFIRFWGYGGDTGTFGLCVTTTSGQTSQQDCAGAFTICSSLPFTGTAFGGGCSSDLAAANRGCLAQGELQGSWYAFSTQNAGTLGVTITPSTPADLDWALWGPYPLIAAPDAVGNVCVPAAPPIRCSHASFLNTTTVGGANPTAATGFGRNTFGGVAANAAFAAVQTDALDGWVPGISDVVAGQVYLLFVDDHHLTGASHSVAWVQSPSDVVGCILLPVDQVTLTAQPLDKVVDLSWTTSTEHNNSHFVVERSANGIDFTAIGSVAAMGERTIPTNYRFTDQDPIKGLNYYRVHQVDHDGTQDPSNVVDVLFEPDEVMIMVVPNPARNSAELVLSAAYDGTLLVRILDGSGRVVTTQRTMSGVQRFDLPIEKMEAGSYVVHLFTEKGIPYARTRFVKQ